MKQLVTTHHRNKLNNTKHALENGKLTIGFLGGSITQHAFHNWPEPVANWIAEKYPSACIQVENAAIGATGSDLAVFRAQRDIIDRNCDIVFVEYAVNDWNETTERRNRTREGLVRKLLKDGKRDVVLVYTFRQEMYSYIMRGEIPDSISEFERIAEHYGIGSVWAGLYAFREVQRGKMRWEEWLPDGLHPQYRGSYSYACCVIEYLEKELSAMGTDSMYEKQDIPMPLNQNNWQNACILPISSVKREGPWKLVRSTDNVWIDYILATSAPGSKLSFEFQGQGILLGFDFGKTSSEFQYRLDEGEWLTSCRDRPLWCGERGWFRTIVIFEDLSCTNHSVEMMVVHGDRPECTGTNFYLALIGVIY